MCVHEGKALIGMMCVLLLVTRNLFILLGWHMTSVHQPQNATQMPSYSTLLNEVEDDEQEFE